MLRTNLHPHTLRFLNPLFFGGVRCGKSTSCHFGKLLMSGAHMMALLCVTLLLCHLPFHTALMPLSSPPDFEEATAHLWPAARPWLVLKGGLLAADMQSKELAITFLANERRLGFAPLLALQESGLAHLLAISGGQISPLLSSLWGVIAGVLLCALRPLGNPLFLLRVFEVLRSTGQLLGAGVLAVLFGSSGALVRVTVLNFARLWAPVRQASLIFFESPLLRPWQVSSKTVLRCGLLLLLRLCLGNPFASVSFLLSALGASVACLSASLAKALFPQASAVPRGVFATLLTTLCVGVLLAPLQTPRLVPAIGANLLALPLVNLAITPLCLLLLLLPVESGLAKLCLQALDACLLLFLDIAHAFAPPANDLERQARNPFAQDAPLFSAAGAVYLTGVLLLVWVLEDLRATWLRPWRHPRQQRAANSTDHAAAVR